MFLTGTVKRPDEGGLLGPDELGVPAVVASFPFLREGRVVDFMKEAGEWYGEYAGRVAGITSVYNEALVDPGGSRPGARPHGALPGQRRTDRSQRPAR